jgi:hypothetical protein
MPTQTPHFSDEQLNPVTGDGTPTSDESGAVRWKPNFRPASGKRPRLHIYLGYLSFVLSITVQVKGTTTVTITVYLTRDTTVPPVYTTTVSNVDDSKPITVYPGDDKQPKQGSLIETDLGEPTNPKDTILDAAITVRGCFQPLAGKLIEPAMC